MDGQGVWGDITEFILNDREELENVQMIDEKYGGKQLSGGGLGLVKDLQAEVGQRANHGVSRE